MKGKLTFNEILRQSRTRDIQAIKDRTFAANRIAKISQGRSRRVAYFVKDKGIARLLAVGEADLLRVSGCPSGVQFRSGGRLHLGVRPQLVAIPPSQIRPGQNEKERL